MCLSNTAQINMLNIVIYKKNKYFVNKNALIIIIELNLLYFILKLNLIATYNHIKKIKLYS